MSRRARLALPLGASAPALKPIDPVALQATVEAVGQGAHAAGRHGSLAHAAGRFRFGYGATELGGTTPPRADTHFRAASNTKTMTAAVIVLLAQEGKLGFDDPVSKYVEGVPNGDSITIGELLKMRSGLYNYTSAPELAESLEHDPTRAWTPEEVLAIAFKRPPNFAPGTEYEYCNTNYACSVWSPKNLQARRWQQIFQDRLFGPLGMKHTLLPASTSNAIPEPFAHGYFYGSSSYALAMRLIPPISWRRPRRERSSPMTTHGRTRPSLLCGRRRHLDGGRPGDLDARAGRRQSFQCRLQRQWLDSPEAGDPGKPAGQKYGYGITSSALARTRCIFTAARCRATTRSWATIRSTTSRWSYGPA